ncbi:MAG: peptide-methionine (R)-S-oxide reductase [Flavobacterium sp. BFFFF1]|uniref:peptide-methionine (R)-S-oxide reductase MsrB n=1 Tax=Flavobacterium sp. BFFFF1 TaxID=2015557 RepID=UPI000BCA4933|nr:peptide-methionine (R)-S-oxide reductase MsrB [Flavobacterium sp. BFFFF1]OYU79521.1 MAG: peptide-methionine (R)-S-oxide reductase [Flavobacterium sp. BFFFF1]
MKTKLFAIALLLPICLTACGQNIKTSESPKPAEASSQVISKPDNPYYSNTDTAKLNVSDAEWKKVLPPDVYEVSRNADTERPFTGKYWNTDEKGNYYCAACGNKLFRSTAKFSSSCGWPSFYEQDNKSSTLYKSDNSIGMERIEVLCARCGGHLGHIFDDGPEPTGKRYCMNSIVLDFVPDSK